MDSFRRPILTGFFRIGVNGRRHFGRRPVITLRVSFRPFEDLRAVSAPYESLRAVSLSNRSNRFMALTVLEPHLMLANDNFLD